MKLVEKSATSPRGFGSVERYTSGNVSRYNSTCRSVISSFSSRCETIVEAKYSGANSGTKIGPGCASGTRTKERVRSIPRNLNSRSRLVANNHGYRRRGSLSASIIISHAVATEHIPVVGRLAGTYVDSMLFSLITFIIGFKVSRPLVRCVSNAFRWSDPVVFLTWTLHSF